MGTFSYLDELIDVAIYCSVSQRPIFFRCFNIHFMSIYNVKPKMAKC